MKIRFVSLMAACMLNLAFLSTVHAEQTRSIGIPSKIPGVLMANASDVIKLADFDEEMVIFDTRTATERKRGKISWSEGLQQTQLTKQHFGKALASKETVVLFYGNKNCPIAAKGAKFAAAKGYKNVYWLAGGWSAWAKSGLRLDM